MITLEKLLEEYIRATKSGKAQWDLWQEPSSKWDDYCYRSESAKEAGYFIVLKKNSDTEDYLCSLREEPSDTNQQAQFQDYFMRSPEDTKTSRTTLESY